MAHSDQSSFSSIESLNQSSSCRENCSRRTSHQRTRQSRTQDRQEEPYRSHMHSLAECCFSRDRSPCLSLYADDLHVQESPAQCSAWEPRRSCRVSWRQSCVDTDWKIVSGVIADAELEEDATHTVYVQGVAPPYRAPRIDCLIWRYQALSRFDTS